MTQDELWYKNAIIYAIDVHRYVDSDGDGRGDFTGLTERLDYLAELGVTCVWLLPIYPTPDRDNGYDVKDYFNVDPRLGELQHFLEFLHRAGERGIRVILDLVMDHTSNEHPWFEAARRDPGSRFRGYYSWSENPPPIDPDEGSIFPGEEKSVWTYDEIAGEYYHHRFYHFEPDLNLSNPLVLDEVHRVLDYWLSFGISGFRIDAAPHMISDHGTEKNRPENPHGILRDIRKAAEERKQSPMLLGEVDVEPESLTVYFGDGDELNCLFNFLLNNYMYLALAREETEPVERALKQLPSPPPSGQWANFVRNLDELDLERLTDADREEVFATFAPEENMRIYGRGIRRRIAPMLEGDRRRLELVFSLVFSLPGTPMIIYGDEIMMGDDLDRPGREAVRAPMQWSAGKNAGFSGAAKGKLIQPVIGEGPFSYEKVNVEAQREDPDSFYHWMRRLIYTRRSCPEFGLGVWHTIEDDNPAVMAHRCTWKDGIVVAIHNFSGEVQQIDLDLRDQRGRGLRDLFGNGTLEPLEEGVYRIELDPYGYRWYRVQGER